jgi:hypothetical protein
VGNGLSVKEVSDETDKVALKLIDELGLKDKQQISEDDILTVVKALYPEDYQAKLETLLNSKYFNAFYVIDLG